MRLIKLAKDSHWFTEGLHKNNEENKEGSKSALFYCGLRKNKLLFYSI